VGPKVVLLASVAEAAVEVEEALSLTAEVFSGKASSISVKVVAAQI
jgi:hypothetical protein